MFYYTVVIQWLLTFSFLIYTYNSVNENDSLAGNTRYQPSPSILSFNDIYLRFDILSDRLDFIILYKETSWIIIVSLG